MRISEVDTLGTRLGRGSHGVVSARQLWAAGADMSVVPRLVRNGTWTQLWRGMYLTAAHPPSRLVWAQAAVRHADQRQRGAGPTPAAVVTGLAGARALGLRWVPETTRVQVLVGAAVQRDSNEHVLVRRAADLASITPWSWGGVPVAEAARLVVDGARECSTLQDVRGLVLGAVVDGHAGCGDLLELLDRGAVAGTAWTRRAVRDAARGAASPPEAELVDALLGCGRPFYVNPEVRVDGRLVGVPDVYLVGTGVGAEMDSQERHGEREALGATLLRHERASRCGLALVHVTPNHYRADPTGFLIRLFDAVEDRRRRGVAEPAGLELAPRGPLLS